MITPTPRFHVHALVLAAAAVVLRVIPMIKLHAPLVYALVITLAVAALVYSIASFFEPGAHILTKMFSGVAIAGALIAGVTAYIDLMDFSAF